MSQISALDIEKCFRKAFPTKHLEKLAIELVDRGAINDVIRVDFAGSSYCFRARVREDFFAYEKNLVKEAVIGDFLAGETSLSSIIKAHSSGIQHTSVGWDFAPDALCYDVSREIVPFVWSISEWVRPRKNPNLNEEDYFAIGEALSVLHNRKFENFVYRFDQEWQDGKNWISRATEEISSGLRSVGIEKQYSVHGSLADRDAWIFCVVHNDIHPNNIIPTDQGMKIIDWDNAQISPPEFEFVKMKYWTKLEDNIFVSDDKLFKKLLDGYQSRSDYQFNDQIFELCEMIWLLRVCAFELKRKADIGVVPQPFWEPDVYIDAIKTK